MATPHISELEKFLNAFDKQNPTKSDSQLADIKKHARVFTLRDDAEARQKEKDKLWEGF